MKEGFKFKSNNIIIVYDMDEKIGNKYICYRYVLVILM